MQTALVSQQYFICVINEIIEVNVTSLIRSVITTKTMENVNINR